MNRYESVLLDKMVELRKDAEFDGEHVRDILLLLECISEWREPPKEIAVEDGYGAMVGEE